MEPVGSSPLPTDYSSTTPTPPSPTFEDAVAALCGCKTIPLSATPPPEKPCVQLVSSFSNRTDAISIVVLRSPHLIPLATLEHIFQLTLVYTARAFLVSDVSTMSAEDRQDHLVHTFLGGGNVFLLGKLSNHNEAATLDSIDIFAHANFHTYDIPDTDHKALYLSGVCCDPTQQGRGFATKMMTESVKVLRTIHNVKYLTMRTMNHAVVKACKRSCGRENSTEEVKVYPVDDMTNRPDLVHVCNVVAEIHGWKGVVPERLVIVKAYPAFLIPIFCGHIDRSKNDPVLDRVEAIINREQGDAMCCIIDL